MLDFQVEDVDVEYERLRSIAQLEIEFVLQPTTLPWGNRSIYFRDPERQPGQLLYSRWVRNIRSLELWACASGARRGATAARISARCWSMSSISVR